jgi:hypothetical protein
MSHSIAEQASSTLLARRLFPIVMAPSSQELEPPANPGRFTLDMPEWHVRVKPDSSTESGNIQLIQYPDQS